MKPVMKMLSLQHPYIRVQHEGHVSYGGGQQFCSCGMVNKCGCGIIAALDALIYLYRYHPGEEVPMLRPFLAEQPIPCSAYDACVDTLRLSYFPMIPHSGINGLMLAAGMQLFFRHYRLPFRARWCSSYRKLWPRMEKMLEADLPVILSAGPNFPFFWRNEKACFYVRSEDGSFHPAAAVRSHYFTVTGMDAQWLRISSWGRMYYVNRKEFERFITQKSAALVSNLLYLEKI